MRLPTSGSYRGDVVTIVHGQRTGDDAGQPVGIVVLILLLTVAQQIAIGVVAETGVGDAVAGVVGVISDIVTRAVAYDVQRVVDDLAGRAITSC